MKELETTVDALQRRVTALEVQWGDTLDRIKSMMGRLMRARQRDDERNLSQEHLSDEDVSSGQTSLNERQAAAQQRILSLRKRTAQQ